MNSSFDAELYGVYTLISIINSDIHTSPHQKYIIYIYNQSVLGLIETHDTTKTIPYDQQGYNILFEIIEINRNHRNKLKWEWVHSHQEINTPGEW